MSQTYQTKNFTAHGGAETVIGGKLTFLAGAEIDDQAGAIAGAAVTPAAAQADSEAGTVAALKNDFNALLAKLRAAGLMAEETVTEPVTPGDEPADPETPGGGTTEGNGENAGGGT